MTEEKARKEIEELISNDPEMMEYQESIVKALSQIEDPEARCYYLMTECFDKLDELVVELDRLCNKLKETYEKK